MIRNLEHDALGTSIPGYLGRSSASCARGTCASMHIGGVFAWFERADPYTLGLSDSAPGNVTLLKEAP